MYIIDDEGLNGGISLKKITKGAKNFAKKNIRLKNVNLKNAMIAAEIGAAFIPAGGAASKILKTKVGKVVTKVKDSKVGKFAVKVAKSKTGKAVIKAANSKVGKFAIKQVKAKVDPLIKNVRNQVLANQASFAKPPIADDNVQEVVLPNGQTATQEQIKTIAEVKGVTPESIAGTGSDGIPTQDQMKTLSDIKDIPQDNLNEELKDKLDEGEKEQKKELLKDAPKSKINPFVIGGIVVGVLGIGYVVSKN